MPIENFLIVLGCVLSVGMFVAYVRLTSSVRTLNRLANEMDNLLKAPKQPWWTMGRINRLRKQHQILNSPESANIIRAYEEGAVLYVKRFRILLLLIFLSGVIVISLNLIN